MSVRLFLAAALLASSSPAQMVSTKTIEPTISGVVRDSAGAPLADVEVAIVSGNRMRQFVMTAADGKFVLTGMAATVVPLRVRRVGYSMQMFDVDARLPASKSLEIVLTTVATELEEVTIAGTDRGKLREFYERKENGRNFARFLEQSDIRRMGATRSSELFRNMPGIVLRNSSAGGNTLRVRDCQPMVWIDGQRVPGAELDEIIQPSDIAAIEFYPSSAGVPAQYTERGNRLCGAIIVWSRTQ